MKRSIVLGLLAALAFAPAAHAQQTQCVSNAKAGGTVDHITIPLQPCALNTNLLILTLSGANTITQPTLQMQGYPQQNIYTNTGTAPGIAALPGANAVVLLTSTGSSWKILSGNAPVIFSGVLTVPNGGTGLATITTNGLMVGQGTGAVSTVAAGTTGQFLGGNTGSPPSWKTISSNLVSSWSAGSTGFTPSTATNGAVTLAGTLIPANGGTGQTSYAVGDLLYASASATLSKLAGVATGNALLSGGVASAPSWGKIGLTTHVSGVLPVANGGTALSTTPTNGKLLIGNGTDYTLANLSAGSNISITNGAGSISIASAAGVGCTTTGLVTYVLVSDGAGGCTGSSDFTISGALLNGAAANFTSIGATTRGSLAATTGNFNSTLTFPTPFTLGAVSVTSTGTQLNYLNAATGTTGTASTNVVFSTSPTLVTPVLGVATGTSLALGGCTLSTNVLCGTGTVAFSSTVSATQYTSTVSTGTAPLVVSSTTNVANLNASSLAGATFASPGSIGSGTPGSGVFTTLADSIGSVRSIPQSGSDKTGSYSLATTDNGQMVGVGSGGSITIPNSTITAGMVISVFNNTTGNITVTNTITTAYIAGTDSDKATFTLATRGIMTCWFYSSTIVTCSGNIT